MAIHLLVSVIVICIIFFLFIIQFQVHKTILQLACPEVSWEESPTPLDGLSEDVLTTILHYLYAECLPSGLAESSAESCLKATAAIPGFQKFQHLCETFLKNTALKQRT